LPASCLAGPIAADATHRCRASNPENSQFFDSVAGTWDVTVSGTAVEQGVNGDCDATTWTCPTNETSTIVAFQGEIGDWQT
jgi:hypothetical protein